MKAYEAYERIWSHIPTPNRLKKIIFLTICLSFSFYTASNSQDIAQTTPPVAQEKPPVNEDKKQIIQIKAKSEEQYARQESVAKTVISNEELNRYGDVDIVNAMKRVPGVLASKDKLSLVGLAAHYTQVLVDGELPRGLVISDLPMTLIDRVEIYRSGNAEFSSQAIAGTINIILKKLPKTSQTQLKFSISDDFERRRIAESFISDTSENLSYGLTIKLSDRKAIARPPQKEIVEIISNIDPEKQSYSSILSEASNAQQIQLRPQLQFVTASGSRINLTSSLTHIRVDQNDSKSYRFISGKELPIRNIENKRNTEIGEFKNDLKISTNIFDNAKLDLSVGVKLSQTEGDLNGWAVDSKSENKDMLKSNFEYRGLVMTSKGKFTVLEAMNFLSGYELVAGWDFSTWRANYILMDSRAYVDTMKISSENVNSDFKVDELAFFAQTEWKFAAQAKAYLGLRWESVKLQDKRISNDDNSSNQNNRQRYTNISPIAQTLWQLNPENTDRVRLALSRAYQAPRQDLAISPKFMSVNASMQNPISVVNYALRPEVGWSYQASYEHNGADEWNYNVNASVKSIDDLQRPVLSYFDNTWWISTVNSGHGLSKILSIDTQFPLTKFLQNWPKLLVNFAISKNWSRVSFLPPPDNRLSPISLSVNLGIDYHAENSPLSIGTSLRYNDSPWQQLNLYTRSLSATQPQLDFYASWTFDKKTQLRIAANNLIRRAEEVITNYTYNDTNASQLMIKPSYRNITMNFEHIF